ncbi:hypothetical protein [uncultured Methanobrevibacter sp.]|uniref:hypothetical protein n=1 Tax=uncultured Methanobrevibacter sp. TaxID=253161 RepID=UPI0025DFFA31|nr:hypothetical protein [uncultured Methanobrevibacter sp.]
MCYISSFSDSTETQLNLVYLIHLIFDLYIYTLTIELKIKIKVPDKEVGAFLHYCPLKIIKIREFKDKFDFSKDDMYVLIKKILD